MRISGEWTQSNSEECFEIRNPATSESLGWVPKGTREDVEKAIEAATLAFEVWSKFDSRSRAKILIQGAELVRSHKDELAVTLTKENGKPLRESGAEIEAFSSEIEYFANLIRVATGEYVPISEAAERLCGSRVRAIRSLWRHYPLECSRLVTRQSHRAMPRCG